MPQTLSDFSANRLNGTAQALSDFAGQVVLVVNVASQCGLTPHYEGLEALYRKYSDRGFVVLGFPCNQFGNQEPGTSEDIAQFCTLNFGVSFPMFERIEVNGDDAHPLYDWLKSEASGAGDSPDIEWNFAKFLIGRDGKVVSRHAVDAEPAGLAPMIEALL